MSQNEPKPTLDILIARARRSEARWQLRPHDVAAEADYVIDCIAVAICQAITSSRQRWDPRAHEEYVTRLAYLLCGTPDYREVLSVVEPWLAEDPSDDVIDQLVAAMLLLESGEVTADHWLRAGQEAA